MLVLNHTGRTACDPADLLAFEEPPKPELLEGPLVLHRFGNDRGRWWYGKTLLDETREDYIDASLSNTRLHATELTMPLRDGLAVTRQWNKLQWVARMDLKDGQAVEAWVGLTGPQLEWSNLPDGRILHGGLTQYLIYDLSKVPGSILSKQSFVSLCRTWGKTISGVRVPK